MEPEVSLPCSQEPSTLPILSRINSVRTTLSIPRSIVMLSLHLRLCLPSGLFPSLTSKFCLHSFWPLCVLHAFFCNNRAILLFLIILQICTYITFLFILSFKKFKCLRHFYDVLQTRSINNFSLSLTRLVDNRADITKEIYWRTWWQ
jgi:hypothetical protein